MDEVNEKISTLLDFNKVAITEEGIEDYTLNIEEAFEDDILRICKAQKKMKH